MVYEILAFLLGVLATAFHVFAEKHNSKVVKGYDFLKVKWDPWIMSVGVVVVWITIRSGML